MALLPEGVRWDELPPGLRQAVAAALPHAESVLVTPDEYHGADGADALPARFPPLAASPRSATVRVTVRVPWPPPSP